MNALFIGRFQPFHKGHLKVLQDILKKYDEIIIGIGSSQYSHVIDNPFSEEERKKMIKETFKMVDIKNYEIIAIPDIHDPPNWVSHVLSIAKDFDVVISNDVLEHLQSRKHVIQALQHFHRISRKFILVSVGLPKSAKWVKILKKMKILSVK